MEIIFENVNSCSKTIAYNNTVQKALSENKEIKYEDRTAIQDVIIQNMTSFDEISSIYLFDDLGKPYVSGDIYEVEIIRKHLKDLSYFETSFDDGDKNKAFFIMDFPAEDGVKRSQILSFVRRVRNINTMKDMGIVVINVPVTKIQDTVDTISSQSGIEIALMDSEDNKIIASQNGEWLTTEALEKATTLKNESYEEIKRDSGNYKIGIVEDDNKLWYVIGGVSRSIILSNLNNFLIISILVLILGIAFCVLGATYITSRIMKPVSNILNSMEQVRDNSLERIPIIETNLEIDNLQQRYNHMLDEIEKLMSQKIEEQRLRRKYELSLLQEQIKPHFLYNTFDSVCALAKMGESESVYIMMQALGQYYRGSLHKGKTVISIEEEIKIVENYLIIQSYRYDDVFEVVYDVDDNVKTYKTIKLILQPLVENAIYHGFRENGLSGHITIRAKDEKEYVRLEIEDDGIGMSKEMIDKLLVNTYDYQGKRFGLPGTIQRINLYYGYLNRNLVDIKSEYGKGTIITIWIPKEGGIEYAEHIDY